MAHCASPLIRSRIISNGKHALQQLQHFRQYTLASSLQDRSYKRKAESQQHQGRKMSNGSPPADGNNVPLSPWQQGFYRYFLPIQTRVQDTDWFGHVNNVVYCSFSDSVVNHFLIRQCGLQHPRKDPDKPNTVGFMVDTKCTFRFPFNYPEVVLAGMSITKLGNSSVTYTVGIFPENPDGGVANHTGRLPSLAGDFLDSSEIARFGSHQEMACAVGQCVHVFVDLNGEQKPIRIPDSFRIPFQKIHVPYESKSSKL